MGKTPSMAPISKQRSPVASGTAVLNPLLPLIYQARVHQLLLSNIRDTILEDEASACCLLLRRCLSLLCGRAAINSVNMQFHQGRLSMQCNHHSSHHRGCEAVPEQDLRS